MKVSHLMEPELDFGVGRHVDIRFGIANYGPLDVGTSLAPTSINIGVIGDTETAEGLRTWLDRARREIAGKASNEPNLFPSFPGYNAETGFRSTLVIEDRLCREIGRGEISLVARLNDRAQRIEKFVDLFLEEIRYLAQNTPSKVIICAPPIAALEAMGPGVDEDEESDNEAPTDGLPDFHDLLKARAMQQYHKPVQIILPSTYDESKHRKQSKAGRLRTLQDEATRAWNVHTALYYKADGVPWRLTRDSTALTACYVGISFYKDLNDRSLLTSVAQVFNERGEGVVVQGGAASVSKEDRQPHLDANTAFELLKKALSNYRNVHYNSPARLVVHKSSSFNSGELEGFENALKEERIASRDFVSFSNSRTRLFRIGEYPPLRGTLLRADEREMILYTRGSVEFFQTYPGMYVPVPLRVRCDAIERTQTFLAAEILGLTKMNWNNTQFDGSEPVTLRAARQCSSVLRYCVDGQAIEPRYSYYM